MCTLKKSLKFWPLVNSGAIVTARFTGVFFNNYLKCEVLEIPPPKCLIELMHHINIHIS